MYIDQNMILKVLAKSNKGINLPSIICVNWDFHHFSLIQNSIFYVPYCVQSGITSDNFSCSLGPKKSRLVLLNPVDFTYNGWMNIQPGAAVSIFIGMGTMYSSDCCLGWANRFYSIKSILSFKCDVKCIGMECTS